MNTEQREGMTLQGLHKEETKFFNSLNAKETLSKSQEQREPMPMPKLAR